MKTDTVYVDVPLPRAREEVYLAIEGEREYQDVRWPGHKHNLAEYFMFIEEYIHGAKSALTRLDDPEGKYRAMHVMRKVAAMAVAAMEQNGVITRGQEEAVKAEAARDANREAGLI